MTIYRRVASSLAKLGALVTPSGKVLLDVALQRHGVVQHWTIATVWPAGHWRCRLVNGSNVATSSCATTQDVLLTGIRWSAEIAVAREDGWTAHEPPLDGGPKTSMVRAPISTRAVV